MKKSVSVILATIITGCASASFSDTFESSSIESEWSQKAGTWVLDTGTDELTVTGIGGSGNGFITTSAVPAGTPDFTMSMDFQFSAVGTDEDWAGLTWNYGNTTNQYVWRVRSSNGRATLTDFGGDVNLWNSSVEGPGDSGILSVNNTYRLTVTSDTTGTFRAQLIDVDGGDAGVGVVIYDTGNVVDATPRTGGDFGIYARENEDNELRIESFSVVAELASVAITNHSFEADIIPRDGSTATANGNGSDDYHADIVPLGWTAFDDGRGDATLGNRGLVSTASDSLFGLTLSNTPDADPNDQAFFTINKDIYQVLGTTLAANTTYTLSIDVGDRTGFASGSPVVNVGYGATAGSNILLTLNQANSTTQVDGDWVTWNGQFTTGATPAGLGQALRIELTGGAAVNWFDNVRLNDGSPASPPTPIDLYLLGGQSNMQGVGRKSKLPTELTSIPEIKFYHSSQVFSTDGANHWITVQPAGFDTDSFGPEIGFGEILKGHYQGADVGFIKHATGGTNLISDWKPGANAADIGNWGTQFTTFVNTVNNAIAALEADGYAPVIKGMAWQQGERDATNISHSGVYGVNLSLFIARIREQFAGHAAPEGIRFVAGQVLPYAPAGGQVQTSYPGYLTVRQAVLDVDEDSNHALSVLNVGAIPTNSTDHPTHEQEVDGYRDTDEVHLNAVAQLELGRSMAYEMLNIPPAAPTGLLALSSPGSVILDWNDNMEQNLVSYKVYRKEGSGAFSLLATVTAPISTYTDSSASSGVTYTYQVTAFSTGGKESVAGDQAVGAVALDLSPSANKPNVIIVLADDQGWGDTGYNGHSVVLTPSLDAMAADGYVFHRFYAAAPVCSPSRAGLLTGRHPIRCKVPNHGRYMREQEMTIAEAFKGAGYVTGMFGKVHLGSGQPDSPANPTAMGFDEWVIGLNFFDNNPYLSRNGVVEHPTGKGTDITMDEAIGFLNTHKNGTKPMFATVWFPSPHSPHEEIPSGATLYSGNSNAGYFREITLLDENVGRLRQWLRDNSIEQNTILWYCSDNGGLLTASSGGRDKKGSIYEGGLRVPAIVEWPARDLKGFTNTPVVHTDMYPTLLAMAGISVENQLPLDGVDVTGVMEGVISSRDPMGFWHLFQNGESTYSDTILSAIMAQQQAGDPTPHNANRIKKDIDEFPAFSETASPGHAAWLNWPWKLHRINAATYELYNLESDPMETTNLSAIPEHAQRFSNMQTELLAWQQSVVRSINGADYGQLDMWLPFNRAKGIEVFDASGGKRGDLVHFSDDTSHWISGKHNRALELDGVDDQVDIANSNFYPPVGANARSVSAWIKTTGSGLMCKWGDNTINGAAWELSIDVNGRLHLDVSSGSVTGQTDLRDGLWHHMAVVLPNDGTPNVTEVILYIDGATETVSASAAQAIRTSNTSICLGGSRLSSANLCIDEFRIVSRAMTPVEVANEFNATKQASAAWLFRNFGSVASVDWTSDSDGDGLDLRAEYALGSDPLVSDQTQISLTSFYNPITKKLEITYPQRIDGTHDLGYDIEVSRDLTDWTLPWTLKSTVAHPSLDQGKFELKTTETNASMTTENRLFMRLSISD